MLLCKELILIRDQPPRKRGSPRATLKTWWIHVVWEAWQLILSGFSSSYVPGVCCSVSVPSWVFVLRSPQELSIMPLAENDFSHLRPLPAARLRCPVPPVVEGCISVDSLYYLIQWVESKGEVAWELFQGLGYSGSSSPPSWAYLQPTSFIGRFFPVYTRGRHDLSSCGIVRPKSWQREGVRIWKLSRTYPGEKPPSLSVLTHRCSLATRNPTQHLLAIPYILVRIRATYESAWLTQFHLPRNCGAIFNSRFFKFSFLFNILFIILYLILAKIIMWKANMQRCSNNCRK